MAMPNGSAKAVATIEMRSDSSTAVHSAGERSSIQAFCKETTMSALPEP